MRGRSRSGSVKSRRRKPAPRKRTGGTEAARSSSSSVANLTRELDERQEQQRATSEILGVLARSRTDVQSVLETVCRSAAQLCKAYDAAIWRPHGD